MTQETFNQRLKAMTAAVQQMASNANNTQAYKAFKDKAIAETAYLFASASVLERGLIRKEAKRMAEGSDKFISSWGKARVPEIERLVLTLEETEGNAVSYIANKKTIQVTLVEILNRPEKLSFSIQQALKATKSPVAVDPAALFAEKLEELRGITPQELAELSTPEQLGITEEVNAAIRADIEANKTEANENQYADFMASFNALPRALQERAIMFFTDIAKDVAA